MQFKKYKIILETNAKPEVIETVPPSSRQRQTNFYA